MIASQKGYVGVIKVLLKNDAQVDLQNRNGLFSLMFASHNGHVDVVKMLLENDALYSQFTR